MRAEEHVKNRTDGSASLTFALATLWLALCASLVHKHNQLAWVFAAFSTSFLATLVQSRSMVDSLACFLSLLLQQQGSLLSLTPQQWSLCIMAGNIASGMWYTAMYDKQRVVSVLEDAASLTAMITLLVHSLAHESTKGMLEEYSSVSTAWIVYRFFCISWQSEPKRVSSSKSIDTIESSDDATSVSVASILQDDDMVKSTKPSADLWIIHGQSYDFSNFVHPGGKEALLLGRGRDCTALLESYHAFSTHKMLDRYRQKDEFYDVLKDRVGKRLREHGIHPHLDRTASKQRSLYYVLVVLAVVASAIAHARGSVLGSIALAVSGWLLGALGHDAGHFAASRTPWVNDAGVWGMSLLCNPVLWQHQHTYAHHSFTNHFDHDPDVHHFATLLRVHRNFKQQGIYKYQKYWPFVALAYAFVCFGTCFWIPITMIWDSTLYGLVEWTDKKRPIKALSMWGHLLWYAGFIMVWPYFVHAKWWTAWLAITAHVSTSGWIFAIFSQINHINEASFVDVTNKKYSSWAVSQVETSNNFCPDSSLWHFLSNGLNLQIEHHLFPGLNHCHLPLIHDVVRRTCKEYGVRYKCHDSWRNLMSQTLQWLDHLSESS